MSQGHELAALVCVYVLISWQGFCFGVLIDARSSFPCFDALDPHLPITSPGAGLGAQFCKWSFSLESTYIEVSALAFILNGEANAGKFKIDPVTQ